MARTVVKVNPGICGFECKISAWLSGKKSVRIDITESHCTMIQKIAVQIHEVSLHDLYSPLTGNMIFKAVEQAGCHLACPVPVAIVKAAEAALGLALPKDAAIFFIE